MAPSPSVECLANELKSEMVQLLKFKEPFGCSLDDYIELRRMLCGVVYETYDKLKASTKKNGIARISGGAGGIASGITALGGLLAAPATGGASLALTATSLGLGVASGATTFAASMANHKDMKDGAEAVKDEFKKIEELDKKVSNYVAGICDKFEKISRLDRAEDVTFILNTTCKSIFQAYSLYSNGSSIAKIVTAEEFTRSFAKTMAAPNRLGVVKAGSTAAKSVSAAMAAAGIGLGIYDIIGGSEELKGNMADGFLDAAIAVTGATDLIKQIIYFATGRAVPFEGLILMGNQALDIVDETTDELCMFRIHGELNQRWELTDDQHLRSKINGKVLDVENGTLRMKTRQDAVNPKWKFENGRLHNVTTGGTLHVSHDRQLGTQPSTATVGAELHVASALNEDLVLEIRDGEDRTGAWVVLWPRHGGRNQVWKMMENGQLKSMMNGKVMDVWKERAVEDAKIRMHTPLGDGDRNQQWRLTNGYLESKMSSDLVMDLRGSSVHQGNKVRLANKTDASSQKWVLRPLSQQNVFLGQEVTISSLEQSRAGA